jgi:hypothetical protein
VPSSIQIAHLQMFFIDFVHWVVEKSGGSNQIWSSNQFSHLIKTQNMVRVCLVEMDQFVKINLIKWLMLSIELTCTLKPRGMYWRMPAHWVGRREVLVVSLTKCPGITNGHSTMISAHCGDGMVVKFCTHGPTC